jgi:hypothetical protein
MSTGSLASTKSIIDGLELSVLHISVEGGFMHVMPLSPSQSVKWLAHGEGVRPCSDHIWA